MSGKTLTVATMDRTLKKWMDGPYGDSLRAKYGDPKPALTLSTSEAKLAFDALGFWRSDDNDAPSDEIEALRARIREFLGG